MKWERHYTGIEIYNPSGRGDGWYLQRRTSTKSLEFVRFTAFHRGFVLHLGYLNYFKDFDGHGFEFSSYRRHFSFGISIPHRFIRRRRFFQAKRFDRSGVAACRIGWCCFGIGIPKFLNSYLNRRAHEKWEREMEDMCPPQEHEGEEQS